MKYTPRFKRKKQWFWRKVTVMGHSLNTESNRMDFFMEDGSILSIGDWSSYDFKLGTDWVLSTKKRMEEESSREVKLTV
jgi:hypothetical protein